jgi:hypothetical protein
MTGSESDRWVHRPIAACSLKIRNESIARGRKKKKEEEGHVGSLAKEAECSLRR